MNVDVHRLAGMLLGLETRTLFFVVVTVCCWHVGKIRVSGGHDGFSFAAHLSSALVQPTLNMIFLLDLDSIAQC